MLLIWHISSTMYLLKELIEPLSYSLLAHKTMWVVTTPSLQIQIVGESVDCSNTINLGRGHGKAETSGNGDYPEPSTAVDI